MQSHAHFALSGPESGSWGEVVRDVDDLLQDHKAGSKDGVTNFRGIRKRHWKPVSDYPTCMNPKCGKKFTLLERNHHCRRCGHIFCYACCSYQRRLNTLAQPDPGGRNYKVCEGCFEEPQSLGAHRNLIDDFNSYRWALLQRASNNHGDVVDGRISLQPGLRTKLDLMKAQSRLSEGFRQSLQASMLTKAATSITALLRRPSWKQAPNHVYERLVPQCRGCSVQFGLLQKRHFCCVCGAAICLACSLTDLIVYVVSPEDVQSVKWAIIKIVGCPDKEPENCEYLRICSTCRHVLAEYQCKQFQLAALGTEDSSAWRNIEKIFSKLHTIRTKIDKDLPMYQERIDSLTAGTKTNGQQAGSSTQLLAKAQGDLSDYFTKLVLTAQGMKDLQPATKCQTTIIRNITKSTFQFYHESVFVFRDLQRRLEAITPMDVLTTIQGIVDKDAINSCYLSVKQLVLEVLHLTTKSQISDTLLFLLTPLEQVVLEDLERAVVASGANWGDHQSDINQLLKLQLKDHKLIKLSARVTEKIEIEHLLWWRVTHLVTQIQLQLLTKTADRKFSSTKAALDNVMSGLSDGNPTSGIQQ